MFEELIANARNKRASDVHIESDVCVAFRIQGELVSQPAIPSHSILLEEVKKLLGSMWEEFYKIRSIDFSHTFANTRCRFNVYYTTRGVALAVRLLYSFHTSLKKCNLHPDLQRFTEVKQGLILVSGPTGTGKSTTLAGIIEEINQKHRKQIVTVEHPIEYFYQNRLSFIRQREIGSNTPSYVQAITDAMREDIDAFMIGEMRTPEVMRLALDTAETGHLVLSTMHSATCAEAVSRICMSFSADIQPSIQAQLADSLYGVICQRFVYLPKYKIRVPTCEVMIANSAIKALIREGKFSHIISSIQTGRADGMWSFERYQAWIDSNTDWVLDDQAK